uniref:protein RGF1 INDUCIBLE TRANSCRIPTION FACTOR 1-like n=1 Tax=Erigeron canadensis TaxID=72917 RepID=UPI001CB9A517|nr:protein RGF1 INDUCIBLE TRANSCRIPTION FACTOR 1-like [Erigeron canadensis]
MASVSIMAAIGHGFSLKYIQGTLLHILATLSVFQYLTSDITSLGGISLRPDQVVDSLSSTCTMPLWLKSLFSEEFYNACGFHENEKKNERNLFCIDCCAGICSHCSKDKLHRSHHLIQIRKYMYQGVIKVEDAGKLMNCSSIQPYISNSAKVVFLHPRQQFPQTKVCKITGNRCGSCNRALQEKYQFCSIFCKITNEMSSGEMMSENLHESEVSSSPEPGSEDGLMTPESVLEPFASLRTSSSSSASCGPVDCLAFLSTATTEIVKKKRTPKPTILAAATASNTGTSLSRQLLANRRKVFPCRSPLY